MKNIILKMLPILILAIVMMIVGNVQALAQSADQEVVSVVDSPDPVTPGSTLSYTITIRNNGPDSATNGGVNVNLPSQVTYLSAVTPAGFTCFFSGNNGTCNTPSFAAGSTAVITINAQVGAHLANFPDQNISANFFPSGTTIDPNSANNSKTATTAVDSPQIDLSLTVTDSPDPVFPDGNIAYTVTVSNGGPDAATNVNFNVVPSSGLRFQSATIPAGWNCTLPALGSINATFTCTRASMAADASSTFTIVFQANDENFGINDTMILSNFNVNGTGNDTNNSNNSENESTQYVTPDADLNITATDSPDPVAPDGNITYTVTITNQGPDTATNTTLNVPLDNTLRFQSISSPAGWNCTLPAVGGGTSFSCTNPSFAAGASATFTIVLRANDEQFGNSNQTIVQNFNVTSGVSDPDNTDNSVNVSTAYVAPPTAAAVSVNGRVLTAKGRAVSGAIITLIDSDGKLRTARTNPFGYYRFAEIESGEAYVIRAQHKQYRFETKVINLNENLIDVDFIASESAGKDNQ